MTPFVRVRWTEQWGTGDKPDLRTFQGVLMSEAVYVPEWQRWICLVATGGEVREMNPRELVVTGVWIPGEPIEEAP